MLLDFAGLAEGAGVAFTSNNEGVTSAIAISASSIVAQVTALQQQVIVAKNGNDATANGSLAKPFLTIAAALASITDASSAKIYEIYVAPGTYTEVFALKPWVFIVGSGRDTTTLSPVQANWLGAGFAGAAAASTGVSACTLGAPFNVDFNAVGSTGTGIFFASDLWLSASATMTVTGAQVLNQFVMQSVQRIGSTAALTHVFSNIITWLTNVALLSDNLTTSSNFGTPITSRFSNVALAGTLTIVAAGSGRYQVQVLGGQCPLNPSGQLVLTGDNVQLQGPDTVRALVAPDANTTFDFFTLTPGATKLVGRGTNLISAANTADRTYTFNSGNNGDRVFLKNTTAFFITLSFVGAVVGDMTYVPPFGTAWLFFNANAWYILNTPQFGQATLLPGGKSAFIAADITAKSSITATLSTWNGVAGVISALDADRIPGTRAGGGGFKLSSIDLASGTVVTSDQGIYNWQING